MATQKFIQYNPIDISGQLLDKTYKLNLNVIETSGNYLLHKDLLRHSSNLKQGTASTKTRSEVRGGGRKPWRQKGTGRARAGSNRSPLWKGGGIIFGPKPQKRYFKLNKKERRLAIQTILYNKKNNILLIEDLETNIIEPKTKKFIEICQNCSININQKILVIVSKKTKPLKLALQNLSNCELISANNINTYSLLKADQIILTSNALNEIKEIYYE